MDETGSTLWGEWGVLTRFLESARLAFARERLLWHSLELHHRELVKINVSTGPGRYKVSLNDHIRAIEDEETLYASVLIHTYALAESAAYRRLGMSRGSNATIEIWGTRLLEACGRGWEEGVLDGKAGAVEVAVVRNAFAHGSRVIDESAASRLHRVGVRERHVGDPVGLSYEQLRQYRERLRTLLNTGGLTFKPS